MRNKTFGKRRIFTALSIMTLLVLILTAFVGCSAKNVDVKKVDGIDAALGDKAFGYMQTLLTQYADRTLGGGNDFEFAKYLSKTMSDWGYTSEFSHGDILGLQGFKTTFSRYVNYANEELSDVWAYNVIFTKHTSQQSKGEIMLTCQYDNLYQEQADMSGTPWGADGSYESGGALAVMLTLAEQLKDVDLGYDVTFAFFTGGSYCWRGALQYASQLDREKLDSIAIVLNYSMLCGDNLYIYEGETKTTYGSFLNACADGATTKVPNDRNIGQFILEQDSVYNYVNIGMLSNQHYFMNRYVPTANFLSLNWESNANPLFTEMSGKPNVYHTPDDTFENMLARKGEEGIKAQLFDVIKTSLTALSSENIDSFASALEKAESEFPNATAQNAKSASLVNVVFKAVLIALLIGVSYLIKSYVFKNSDKIMPQKQEQSENIEEPFGDNMFDTEVFGENDGDNEDKEKENTPFNDPFE